MGRRHGAHRGHGGHRRRDPRVTRTREVVLVAARKLLVEEGAEAVTALRVSEATGIARTTIYRHWPTRDDLLAAVIAAEEPEPAVPTTGDTRTDLVAVLVHMGETLGRRRGARFMTASIDRSGLSGAAGGPHREMVRRRMEPLRSAIERGIAVGDLKGSLDVDAAVAQLAGPSFFLAIMMRQPADPAFIANSVDAFLAVNAK